MTKKKTNISMLKQGDKYIFIIFTPDNVQK